jgi:hypothetical protein
MAATLCAALFTVVTLSSCGEDSLTGVSRQSQGLDPQIARVGAHMSLPTMQELKTELDLQPQQMGAVASALAKFRSELRQAPSDDVEGADVRIEAVFNLLIRLSPVLDEEQMEELVDLLFEDVPVLEQALNFQLMFFISPEIVQEFADQHNLTPTQEQNLLQAIETASEAYANLQRQILEGQISGANIQVQATAIQQQFVISLQSTLGPLYPTFTTFVQQERTQTINTIIQDLSDDVNAEFQLLDRFLNLNASQETTIQSSLQTALINYQTLLTNINAGTVTFDQAVQISSQIITTLNTSIRGTLTQQQLAKFNAVSFLLTDPFGIVFI